MSTLTRLGDAVVFASVWVALAAAGLCWSAFLALDLAPSIHATAIVAVGTLFVYNVDRLRDLARDRLTTPERSAFVSLYYRPLVALCIGAGALSASLAVFLPYRATLVLLPVLVLGLLHRRLKTFSWGKSAYVTGAWLAVVVGLPATLGRESTQVPAVAAILGAALLANSVASNVRDHEATLDREGAGRGLTVARSVASFGVLVALFAAAPARFLMPIPLLTLAALVGFRRGERYGLYVVDGALVLGAAAATLATHVFQGVEGG